jgi:nucleotide-binding universal stress UspA family protein
MIAVDDSPHSDRAVALAARMRWPAGSRVIVASVIQSAPAPPGIDLEASRRRGEVAVARARSLLRGAGLSTEARILEGDARERLLELIGEERVDLLVMGSRGRNGLSRLLLGSVSNHAATHAPCSVLVVKQPAHD